MKLREKMKESYESMNFCKAVSFLDGKIVVVLHEGRIESVEIDGVERIVTPELIHGIAIGVNDYYDFYKGWDDTRILLDAAPAEIGCCECPRFGVCAAMEEEFEEDDD